MLVYGLHGSLIYRGILSVRKYALIFRVFFPLEDLVAIVIFHPMKNIPPRHPAMSKTIVILSTFCTEAAKFFCQAENLYYGNKPDLEVNFTEF